MAPTRNSGSPAPGVPTEGSAILTERPIPGTGRSIFPLALSISASPEPGGGGGDPFLFAELRGAIRAGIRLFVPPPSAAEGPLAALEAASAAERTEVLAMAPEEPAPPPPRPTDRDSPFGSRVRKIATRHHPGEPMGSLGQEPPNEVDADLGWGVVLQRPYPSPEELGRLLDQNVRWVGLPASILDAAPLEELARHWPKGEGALVILDPYAGGRLDGGFLEPPGRGVRPPRPGDPLRMIQEFAPVLPFGFLARAGRRTLAQAALQYLLGIPRVGAVALPAGRPGTLREALALPRVPSLSSEEVRRIQGIGKANPRAPVPNPIDFPPSAGAG